MWTFIILTFVLSAGITRYIVQHEIQKVTDNWAEYRCDPTIMFWASLFKPKDDPRTDSQYVIDNFSFCSGQIVNGVMGESIKPVMGFSGLMADSTALSINHGMNLRRVSSNIWSGMSAIFNIFGSRFLLVFAQIRSSFFKLNDGLKKAYGLVFSLGGLGVSALWGIYNMWILILIVVIIVCIILIIILLFLSMFSPIFLALLILVIMLLIRAMAALSFSQSFCFHPDTVIKLQNGKTKLIREISINDILADGSTVFSVMKFKTEKNSQLYVIDGIIVSGSHILYENGRAVFVKDVEGVKLYDGILPTEIYCLNTSSHQIPVMGESQSFIFADWEELDGDSMDDWSSFVYNTLNNSTRTCENNDILSSETGFSPLQKVQLLGKDNVIIEKPIVDVRIGDFIRDGNTWTEIIGTVVTKSSENKMYGRINTIFMSGATWMLDRDNTWKHAAETEQWTSVLPVSDIVSIFTKSGSFTIDNTQFRDFSDIGIQHIEKSYDFTLSRLNKR